MSKTAPTPSLKTSEIEKIFQELSDHDKSQQVKLRPYDTRFQKITFWMSVGSLVFTLIIVATSKIQLFDWHGWQKPTALLSVILCQLSVIAYQASTIVVPTAKFLKEPTRHFLDPLTKKSTADYSLAVSFSQFQATHLEYVVQRMELEVDQMKKRIALLAGAIDKVGIVPITITWALAVYKYVVNDELQFSQIDYIIYGLMALYIMAISMIFFVHKLERYVLLIKTAITVKKDEADNTEC